MLIHVLNISFIDMLLHISYLFALSCFIPYHVSFTFLLQILIIVYVSSHSNAMLLISCHVIFIFLSFILCFMPANTLELSGYGNYKDPKVLLSLYETMTIYKGPKALLSLYETITIYKGL